MRALSRRKVIAAAALPLGGCGLIPRVRRFAFKLTLSVNGHPKTGSSVCEFQYSRTYMDGFDAGGYYSQHIWGQSPFVIVDGHQAVFALLKEPQTERAFQIDEIASSLIPYAPDEIRNDRQKGSGVKQYDYAMNEMNDEYEIGRNNRVKLVYFANPYDFWSMTPLPPSGATIAGKEVHLISATLKRTDELVTNKLNSDVLPSYDGKQPKPPLPAPWDDRLPLSETPFSGQVPYGAFAIYGTQ